MTEAFALSALAATPDTPEYKSSWEEFQALKANANGGAKMTPNSMPDWRGVWRRTTPPGLGF
jgi:hypothetical protein